MIRMYLEPAYVSRNRVAVVVERRHTLAIFEDRVFYVHRVTAAAHTVYQESILFSVNTGPVGHCVVFFIRAVGGEVRIELISHQFLGQTDGRRVSGVVSERRGRSAGVLVYLVQDPAAGYSA